MLRGEYRIGTIPFDQVAGRSISRKNPPLFAATLKHFPNLRLQRRTQLQRRPHLLRTPESFMADSGSRASSESDCNGDPKLGPVDPGYAEIIVVRHGETAWNADGRIQGHLDVELNEAGRQQAAAVADRLSKGPRISAVYSSDLKRAFETAQAIATSCGRFEVIKDPDLRERNLGDLQGLVYQELAKINPEAHKAFLSHRTDQEIPGGGESRDQVYQRCTLSLKRIGSKHKGERVVVVTHGGVIRALHKRASPNGRAGKIMNTSVNIFHLCDGDKWVIKAWGDISHLDQTKFLESGFGGDRTSG
ncbi:hypothetical protein AAG906_002284 [Vitis piasezkii]